MNTNDYTDKIYSLLNDEKTFYRITDKKRNPTSFTEKSLNKLLEIKDQPTSHDNNKKQNRISTTNFTLPILHQRHFMASLKSIRRTSYSDQLRVQLDLPRI